MIRVANTVCRWWQARKDAHRFSHDAAARRSCLYRLLCLPATARTRWQDGRGPQRRRTTSDSHGGGRERLKIPLASSMGMFSCPSVGGEIKTGNRPGPLSSGPSVLVLQRAGHTLCPVVEQSGHGMDAARWIQGFAVDNEIHRLSAEKAPCGLPARPTITPLDVRREVWELRSGVWTVSVEDVGWCAPG